MSELGKWKWLHQREVGALSTRSFTPSKYMVKRLNTYRDAYIEYAISFSFNSTGNLLVVSYDNMVRLWDWEADSTASSGFSFNTGHNSCISKVKTIGSTDKNILTCGLEDETLRISRIQEHGTVVTTILPFGEKGPLDISIETGSENSFYVCDGDGNLQAFDLRTNKGSLTGVSDYILPYKIATHPTNPNFLAVGGVHFAYLYDTRTWNCLDSFTPPNRDIKKLIISGLSLSSQDELLVCYMDDKTYLFTRDMGLGAVPNEFPMPTGGTQSDLEASNNRPKLYGAVPKEFPTPTGHSTNTPIGARFFGPSCEYVASGSNNGWIYIWRKKNGRLLRVLRSAENEGLLPHIEPHPNGIFLASIQEDNVKIWIPNASYADDAYDNGSDDADDDDMDPDKD